MLTYVISRTSFSETLKMQPSFFVGPLQKGRSQAFLTETMETGDKNVTTFTVCK